jgi:hypothetical protein
MVKVDPTLPRDGTDFIRTASRDGARLTRPKRQQVAALQGGSLLTAFTQPNIIPNCFP